MRLREEIQALPWGDMNAKQKLKLIKEMGLETIYNTGPINRLAAQEDKTSSLVNSVVLNDPTHHDLVASCNTILELRDIVNNYEGCLLKQTAINTVFADGNPQSPVMFIGEAPGASEDEQGIPFCGQSGKLLTNIIAALGFARQEVYISNTVFWRPPGNRRPSAEELQQCRPFVEKHIALVSPKLLVLVGSTAVESLLDKKTPMQQIRGNFFTYKNRYLSKEIKTYVIFHPSFLLRQPGRKKDMWFDVLKLRKELCT
jgi:DNA polymerase